MNERKAWKPGPGTIVLIVLALIVLAILATRRSRTLGLHQALQLDDFFLLEWLFFGRKEFRLPSGRPSAADADGAK